MCEWVLDTPQTVVTTRAPAVLLNKDSNNKANLLGDSCNSPDRDCHQKRRHSCPVSCDHNDDDDGDDDEDEEKNDGEHEDEDGDGDEGSVTPNCSLSKPAHVNPRGSCGAQR